MLSFEYGSNWRHNEYMNEYPRFVLMRTHSAPSVAKARFKVHDHTQSGNR